jgi:hypothetical protein
MGVIRHQAVRKKLELLLSRCFPKLLDRLRGDIVIAKRWPARERAGCEEILIATNVREAVEPSRARHRGPNTGKISARVGPVLSDRP